MNGISPSLIDLNVPLLAAIALGLGLLTVAFGRGIVYANRRWDNDGPGIFFFLMLVFTLASLTSFFGLAYLFGHLASNGEIDSEATLKKVSDHYGMILPTGTDLPDMQGDSSFISLDTLETEGEVYYPNARLVWENNALSLWVQPDENNPEYYRLEPVN